MDAKVGGDAVDVEGDDGLLTLLGEEEGAVGAGVPCVRNLRNGRNCGIGLGLGDVRNSAYLCGVHQECPWRATNRAARSHGGKAMRMFNQKKSVAPSVRDKHRHNYIISRMRPSDLTKVSGWDITTA